MPIEPDTKDWTWVLQQPCADCGFEADRVPADQLPELLRSTTERWSEVLRRDDVAERPSADVWSPLEYGAHIRDVHRIFNERVRLMVEQETPTFANWDQDETAIAERYGEQDPIEVELALIEAAGEVAGRYAAVGDAQWERRGLRSNGSAFTVASLGRYHLHDVVHHLWDVRG
ncbi:DinB family protein [Nocardioides dubius]|uniref:Maleylpyruvate isomerase N-terminal domain-containing protein n=1 Tax=Nocardioides dubius TaxID=317019 RepID=A0ABN1U2J2_9ACTN